MQFHFLSLSLSETAIIVVILIRKIFKSNRIKIKRSEVNEEINEIFF